ncbi:MAG: hypothetical protein KF819_28135 [Labilithrix sp.]|nr:hypothetical protein [Labilithrix sp.]
MLIEAFGASATPFVPVPFVDDWMHARVLRRIASKALEPWHHPREDGVTREILAKTIADAYVEAGSPPLAKSIVVGAARFVVRKVAVVLDVLKSHDVFGRAIAFALALDIAAERAWIDHARAKPLGAAIHRALARIGSGPLEALARAGKEAMTKMDGAPEGATRMGMLAEALAGEVDKLRGHIDSALTYEVTGVPAERGRT